MSASFGYADADGNLRGGAVQSTAKGDQAGQNDLNFTIPGNDVTITGTTSGTITFQACLRFGANNSITVSVAVVDATQKSSSVIAARVNRPAGAPEIPSGGGADIFGRRR